MKKGINLANPAEKQKSDFARLLERRYTSPPCIFISHKKEDSETARDLADYIKEAGINVFFDEDNTLLNDPEVRKDPYMITKVITKALEKCRYMVCIISEKTRE